MVTPFAQFMSGFASSNLGAALLKDSDFARTLLVKTMPETEAQLRFVQAAATDRSGAPVKTLVYCFCGL
jgi:protease-4